MIIEMSKNHTVDRILYELLIIHLPNNEASNFVNFYRICWIDIWPIRWPFSVWQRLCPNAENHNVSFTDDEGIDCDLLIAKIILDIFKKILRELGVDTIVKISSHMMKLL